jgi:hypothetical protein
MGSMTPSRFQFETSNSGLTPWKIFDKVFSLYRNVTSVSFVKKTGGYR